MSSSSLWVEDAIILAGGKGTRLGSLTDAKPKPLVEIAGKPMIVHQLELLARYNFRKVRILTGHLGEKFPEILGDGERWGLEIHYRREMQPLGTAGAIKDIKSELPLNFLVLYGDVIMDMDLHAFVSAYNASGAIAALAVHPNDHPHDSDLIEFDPSGRITQFHSKKRPLDERHENFVNAAAYCLNRKVTDYIVEGLQDFGLDVFPAAIRAGEALFAYRTAEFIKDVGTPERLMATEKKLLNGTVRSLNREYKQPAVFVDRDGVLVAEGGDALTEDTVSVVPDAGAGIRRLQDCGYHVFMVTNQPGIAKGFIDWPDVSAVHAFIDCELAKAGAFLTDKFICPHHPMEGFEGERPELKIDCECRKPKPGLLIQAAERYNLDLSRSFFIGDRSVDAATARAAGSTPLYVATGYGGNDGICDVGDVPKFETLLEACSHICEQKSLEK